MTDFKTDIKENGSWEMQFMKSMYPEKDEKYHKEKNCKFHKKMKDKNIKDGDIIIRAYSCWLKIKMDNVNEEIDMELFYNDSYFGCNYYPKKWKLTKKNEFITKKSVIEIEQKEKDDFFDAIDKEEKQIEMEKQKKKKKKKKSQGDNVSETKKERDQLLIQRNKEEEKLEILKEKYEALKEMHNDFKGEKKSVDKELVELYAEMEKKGWSKDKIEEFDKVKKFYRDYAGSEEVKKLDELNEKM